ncbi:MAG: gamma-glutamylcyclotransferase family protein [Bacillota bacterium]|nr:gamma-glutamylcyclotransferase family protein [Bacillota bacterium]
MNLKLFVYGTLMSKCQQAALFFPHNAKYIEATTLGKLIDLGEYPGMVPSDDPTDLIYGEVVIAEDKWQEVLAKLDEYEDYLACDEANSLYVRRKAVATITETGEKIEVWCYLYNQDIKDYPIISSGSWLER